MKATQLAIKKLKASHKWVVTEQRRLQLLEQRGKQIHHLLNILVDALMRSTKSIAILSLFALVIAGWAWLGGMNTPSIIACPNTTGLCYRARWRSPKLIVPKPDMTQCMDNRDGLVCLFPHQTQPIKKPHTTKKPQK